MQQGRVSGSVARAAHSCLPVSRIAARMHERKQTRFFADEPEDQQIRKAAE
jgi:hypothetical protein